VSCFALPLRAVVAAERSDDGRLYMVVRALARVRCAPPRAGTALAACAFAPDAEETQARALTFSCYSP
jgi:hypothetical protein